MVGTSAEVAAVGGDEEVGLQQVPLFAAEGVEAGRAVILARLDQDGDVEAIGDRAGAARSRAQQHDGVLPFVVGRAASVQAVAVPDDAPRVRDLAPASFHPGTTSPWP